MAASAATVTIGVSRPILVSTLPNERQSQPTVLGPNVASARGILTLEQVYISLHDSPFVVPQTGGSRYTRYHDAVMLPLRKQIRE